MDIKQSHVISPGENPEDKPDAVKIDIMGVKAIVNLHTGVVTIDGAAHVTPKAGEHNTLEIHACPEPPDLKDLFANIGEEIAPGVRMASIDLLDLLGGGFSLADLLAGAVPFPRP